MPFLKALSEEERSSVVDGLCTKVYYDNDVVIKLGDQGDGIYFIKDGVCSVRLDKGLLSSQSMLEIMDRRIMGSNVTQQC